MNQSETFSRQYPAAMVNITNRCTLRCKHCFVYRDENPNDRQDEMDTPMMLEKLARLKRQHGIQAMLWMRGEPLLRPDVLKEGVNLFMSLARWTPQRSPDSHLSDAIKPYTG